MTTCVRPQITPWLGILVSLLRFMNRGC